VLAGVGVVAFEVGPYYLCHWKVINDKILWQTEKRQWQI